MILQPTPDGQPGFVQLGDELKRFSTWLAFRERLVGLQESLDFLPLLGYVKSTECQPRGLALTPI